MSPDIYITQKNASFIMIEANEGILLELSNFFSFYAKNYYFSPLYKKGRWDGKIRLFNKKTKNLPAGLINVLSNFAKEREYIIEINDINKDIFTDYDDNTIDNFFDDLVVTSGGNIIEFRDYQRCAVESIIKNKRSTILSSTSSGKSLIIYGVVRYFIDKLDGKILIITPNVNLVSQMYGDFVDYSESNKWNVDANVHKIWEGLSKDDDKRVYISTWQSIYKQPAVYFKQFDFVIFDEVHLATAKSVMSIMKKCVNAYYRAGFTGTLKDDNVHRLTIIGYFGDINKVTNTKSLMDAGYVSKLHIKLIMLEYDDYVSKEINKKVKYVDDNGEVSIRNNYRNELDYIFSLEERNIFISNLVNVLNGNVLVLFNKIEGHGIPLYDLIEKRIDNTRKLYYISGKVKVDERENIRKLVDADNNSVLLASYGTFSTGVNIKNINYVIFASPYKSEVKVLQSIGRALRISERKNKAVIFDIVDVMTTDNKHNYCYTHFLARLDIYRKEQFPISVSNYKITSAVNNVY